MAAAAAAAEVDAARREFEALTQPMRATGRVDPAAAEALLVGAAPGSPRGDYILRAALPRVVLFLLRLEVQDPPTANAVLQRILSVALAALAHADAPEPATILSRILAPTASNLFYIKHGRDEAAYAQERLAEDGAELLLPGQGQGPGPLQHSAYLLSNLRFFVRAGGLATLQARAWQAALPRGHAERRPLSLDSLRALLEVATQALALVRPHLARPAAEALRDLALNYVGTLSDDELKTEARKALQDSAPALRSLLLALGTPEPAAAAALEAHALALAERCFQSPYLEKRLQGLQELKDAAAAAQRRDAEAGPGLGEGESRAGALRAWMAQRGVLEQLYGRNAHPELLRRGTDLLRFLAGDARHLEPAQLDLVWAAASQHEHTAVVYATVAELASCLCREDVDRLYAHIAALPLAAYDLQTVALLRTFTAGALQQLHTAAKDKEAAGRGDEPAARPAFGAEQLWALLQDQSAAGTDLQAAALSALAELLQWSFAVPLRVPFLLRCVANLQASRSVPPSLRLLRHLCSAWRARRGGAGEVLEWLDKQHGLLAAFFDDLVHYTKAAHHAQQRLQQQQQAGAGAEADACNWSAVTLVGRQPHGEQVRERLGFLDYVAAHSGLVLGAAQVDALWTCLVEAALTADERDAAFAWLEGAAGRAGREQRALLDDRSLEHLFGERLPGLDLAALSPAGMACLERLLRYLNWRAGCLLDRPPDALTPPGLPPAAPSPLPVTDAAQVRGLETLWAVALEARSPAVGAHAVALLHELQRGDRARRTDLHLARTMARLHEAAAVAAAAAAPAQPAAADPAPRRALLLRLDRLLSLLRLLLDDLSIAPSPAPASAPAAAESEGAVRVQVSVVQGAKFELEMRAADSTAALAAQLAQRTGSPAHALRLIARGRELHPSAAETLAAAFALAGPGAPTYLQPVVLHVTRRADPGTAPAPAPAPGPLAEPKAQLEAPAPPAAAPAPSPPAAPVVVALANEYFADLFGLLSLEALGAEAAGVVERAWDILSALPTNAAMAARLAALGRPPAASPGGGEEAAVAWDEVIDGRGTFTLLYALRALTALLAAPDAADWAAGFARRGGAQHLLQLLLRLDAAPERLTPRRLLCLHLLLRTLCHFLLLPSPSPDSPPVLRAPPVAAVPLSELVARLLALSTAAAGHPAPAPDIAVVADSLRLVAAAVAAEPGLGARLLLSEPRGPAQAWLHSLLLSPTSSAPAREHARAGLALLARLPPPLDPSGVRPATALLALLIDLLPSLRPSTATAPPPPCAQFFELLVALLAQPDALPPARAAPLLEQCLSLLAAHSPVERHGAADAAPDELLIGLLRLSGALAARAPDLRAAAAPRLVPLVVDALFAIPAPAHDAADAAAPAPAGAEPPAAKSRAARGAAFRLLAELAAGDWATFVAVAERLAALHVKDERALWAYSPAAFERAPCGLVGLRNLGATCYMNSLMQQLYMQPALRYALLQLPLSPSPPSPDPLLGDRDSVAHQLQALFANLQESALRYYDTRPFCAAYREPGAAGGGGAMSVDVQMDVDEFLGILFDRLERQLKPAGADALLREVFGGTLSHQVLSRECGHSSEREESFYTLQLEIKNKKTLAESLDLFVQGDLLEGDNRWQCSECGKKVAALKRCSIRRLPNVLVLGLKRFEFDFETMRRAKINDLLEFPTRLSALPWTRAGLQQQHQQQQPQEGGPPLASASAVEAEAVAGSEYELAGVIVHTGTADSGHYYSFARERRAPAGGGEQAAAPGWFLFNDTHVEPFDPAQLAAQCFGGAETVSHWDAQLQRHVARLAPRPYSAYMLFYERRHRPLDPAAARWLPSVDPLPPAAAARLVPAELRAAIQARNAQFHRDRALFDPDYAAAVAELVRLGLAAALSSSGSASAGAPWAAVARASVELGTRAALETLFHSRERAAARALVDLLRPAFASSPEAARWLLAEAGGAGRHWLRQYTLLCDVEETRQAFVALLGAALAPARAADSPAPAPADRMQLDSGAGAGAEGEGEGPEGERSALAPLLAALWALLPEAPAHWRTFGQYFELLALCAGLGAPERRWLAARGAVRDLAELLLGDEAPSVRSGARPKPPKMGDKFASPALAPAVDALVLLVRAALPPQDEPCGPPPTLLQVGEAPVVLAADEWALLLEPDLLVAALKEAAAAPATEALARHLAWGSAARSERVLRAVCAGVHAVDYGRFRPFFTAASAVLALDEPGPAAAQDALRRARVRAFLDEFLRVVAADLKYKCATAESLRFLARLARAHDPLGALVRDDLAARLGDWLEPWLLQHSAALVRDAAAALCQALLPALPPHEALVAARAPGPWLPAGLAGPAAALHRRLFLALLDLLPSARASAAALDAPAELKGKSAEEYAHAFHLPAWLRLLRWAACSPWARQAAAGRASAWADLARTLDAQQNALDASKRELALTLQLVYGGSPDGLAALAACPELFSALLETYVSLRAGHEPSVYYHQAALPPLWDLVERSALAAPSALLPVVLGHRNFEWLWKHAALNSHEYTRLAPLLERLVRAGLDHGSPAARAAFRAGLLRACLDPHFAAQLQPTAATYPAYLRTLAACLLTDDDERLYFDRPGLAQTARLLRAMQDAPSARPSLEQTAAACRLAARAVAAVQRAPALLDAWDTKREAAEALVHVALAPGLLLPEAFPPLGFFVRSGLLDGQAAELLWKHLFASAAPPADAADRDRREWLAADLLLATYDSLLHRTPRPAAGSRAFINELLASVGSFSCPAALAAALAVLQKLVSNVTPPIASAIRQSAHLAGAVLRILTTADSHSFPPDLIESLFSMVPEGHDAVSDEAASCVLTALTASFVARLTSATSPEESQAAVERLGRLLLMCLRRPLFNKLFQASNANAVKAAVRAGPGSSGVLGDLRSMFGE